MANIGGVFYAEFDNIVGPKIVYQSPDGFFDPEDFDAVSEYMITKPDLCGKVVSVLHAGFRAGPRKGRSALYRHATAAAALSAEAREDTAGVLSSSSAGGAATPVKVVTFPVGLSHEKYMRNSLLFSVGFVLPAEADAAPYEPVLRKLGLYLFTMEVESGFLFRPERKAALQHILPAILHGLNARGECFVAVDEVDTIALKLFPSLPRPAAVKDSDVPVRVRDLDVLLGVGSGQDAGLDLCIRAVLPHIDGVNFVRAIAEAADADISLVKRALQHLLYYGCIVMIDIFQYSNIYATQPRVQLLLRSRELSQACLAFVAWDPLQDGDPGAGDGFDASWEADPHQLPLEGSSGAPAAMAPVPSAEALLLRRSYGSFGDALAASGASGAGVPVAAPMTPPPLSVDAVFSLYCAFGAGTRTCDVCAQGRTRDLGLHDRRLVAFGVMHGLLRRLHKYPVPVGGDVAAAAAAARAALEDYPDRHATSSSTSAAASGPGSSSAALASADVRSPQAARRPGEGSSGIASARRPASASAAAESAAAGATTNSTTGSLAGGLVRASSTASTAAAAIEKAAGRPASAPAGDASTGTSGAKADDDASSVSAGPLAASSGLADAASGIDKERERALRRHRASAAATGTATAAVPGPGAGAGSAHHPHRAASSGRLSASPSVSSVDGRSTISRGASMLLKDKYRERQRDRRDKGRARGHDGARDGSSAGAGAGSSRLAGGVGGSLALTNRRGAFDGDGDAGSDGEDAERSEFALQRRSLRLFAAAAPLLDGSRSLEEICCALCCSQSALEECLERQGGFVYVLK